MLKILKILKLQNNGLIKASIFINFVFLLFLYSFFLISKNKSPFDYIEFIFFSKRYLYLIILNIVSAVYIFNFSKLKFLFQIIVLLNSLELVLILLNSYSKLFLIFTGFWLICFWYMYYVVKSELNEAYYLSGIFSNDLFSQPVITLDATVNYRGIEYRGKLTNCSDSGLYIVFETLPDGIAQELVSFKVEFETIDFLGHGQVVSISKYFQGIGIKYNSEVKIDNSFSWADLVQVLRNRKINFWGLT